MSQAPAHDAVTRLLTREPLDTAALWDEVQAFVRPIEGVLVLDNTTLDKPYAKRIELVTRHGSGKHKGIVWGMNLRALVWASSGAGGACAIPCDFRFYTGAQTRNEQFRQMLATAAARGLRPGCVLFDSWYSSLEYLKAI